MTNNSPNSSEKESNKLIAKYEYSAKHEGGNISKSLTAENLNGYLSNGEMTVFRVGSTEGDSEEITIVPKPINEQKILLNNISIDNDHNIIMDIMIGSVKFEGIVNYKIIPAKTKKGKSKNIYEIEFESEKVMIGSQMIIGNEVIEITESNINEFNKRKLSFTELLTDDEFGEDCFTLANGEITDHKNQSVIVEKTKGKFSAYVLSLLAGIGFTLAAQNYSNDSKEYAVELSNEVSSKVSQFSSNAMNSLGGYDLPTYEIKKEDQTLLGILNKLNINHDNVKFNSRANIIKAGELIDIKVDNLNDMNLVDLTNFSGKSMIK